MATNFQLDEDAFVALLTQLIGEAKFVQNAPPKLVPEEDRVIAHVLNVLGPYSKENGGALGIQHVHFQPNRGNLLLEYNPSGATKCVTFMGSHLDVVPAAAEDWAVDPFSLTRDGDKLYGRGTTDCLGHVALVTELFRLLATTKPDLNIAVYAIFIASEENASIAEVGVDMLMKAGYLDKVKAGPVYWVDSADSQPCIGCCAAIQWKLRVDGRVFHSGLPHLGINALELGQEVMAELQRRFYAAFPATEKEAAYKFAAPSSFKPTKMHMSDNSVNQVPPWVEFQGDIRLTPFYDTLACVATMQKHAEEVAANIELLPTRGPSSKYFVKAPGGEEFRGKITFTVDSDIYKGIACSLESPGFQAIKAATEKVKGAVEPFAVGGSLPLVGDMQAAGFDLQICGYGLSSVYHGLNEYCQLSDMKHAMLIFSEVINSINAAACVA